MGNYIRTLVLLYMEIISCEVFVSIFGRLRERRNWWSTAGSYAIVCCINSTFAVLLGDYQLIKMFVIFISLVLFMCLRVCIPVWKCILAVCGYLGIILGIDLVFLMLMQWNGREMGTISMTIVSVIAKTLEFSLTAWLHRRFSPSNNFEYLDGRIWARFWLFSSITVVGLVLLWWDSGYSEITVLVISFGLMFLNVMFYFSMWDIVKKERQNQEFCLRQEKTEGQIKLYQSMEETYEEQRKRVHEFKNHLGCIQGLLEGKETGEALKYLYKIQQCFGEQVGFVKTGNRIVDTIVNAKYSQAVKENVTFVMQLDHLETLPMESEDMVVLLSNLLDNALEACRKIAEEKDKSIKVKLVRRKQRYIIMVSNTVADAVTIINQLAETTKKDKEEHGMGMRNIRDILDKYGAEGECRCKNGWFTYTIVL